MATATRVATGLCLNGCTTDSFVGTVYRLPQWTGANRNLQVIALKRRPVVLHQLLRTISIRGQADRLTLGLRRSVQPETLSLQSWTGLA